VIKKSDKKVREMISVACPHARFIWLTDREYILPKLSEVKEMIADSKITHMTYIANIQECEEFALQLHAEIKRKRGAQAADGKIPSKEWKSWAIGECFAIKVGNVRAAHNLNIVACEEGVFLIEPQTKQISRMDPNKDTILLVRA
jgi:hypothetical protein